MKEKELAEVEKEWFLDEMKPGCVSMIMGIVGFALLWSFSPQVAAGFALVLLPISYRLDVIRNYLRDL